MCESKSTKCLFIHLPFSSPNANEGQFLDYGKRKERLSYKHWLGHIDANIVFKQNMSPKYLYLAENVGIF